MDANLLLWIGQILLALAFLSVGYSHSLGFEQSSTRPGMGWMAAVGRDPMRIIGILETLGAIGLTLPAATRGRQRQRVQRLQRIVSYGGQEMAGLVRGQVQHFALGRLRWRHA